MRVAADSIFWATGGKLRIIRSTKKFTILSEFGVIGFRAMDDCGLVKFKCSMSYKCQLRAIIKNKSIVI